MPAPKRRNVTFELPIDLFNAFEVESETTKAGSRHQKARDIVVERLTNPSTAELAEGIERLDAELSYTQELIRKLTYSVIVHAAGRESEEANRWIRLHMPTRPS